MSAPTAGFDPRAPFAARIAVLPRLGLGISTEFGAADAGLDPLALRADRPDLVRFLEIGCDLARGADATARAWAAAGHATTYHFLDANLEEGDDLDDAWIAETAALARSLGAAWLCGDAGLWHVGPRDRGHGVLLPPVLTPASARAMAEQVVRLRHASGFEVLPENPPAHVYAGELHLLDYFARVAERADSGLLLDVAHLAIHQRATGRAPLDGLADFPLERVVELHVAGATEFEHGGRRFPDDDHSPEPLPETWDILDFVLPRATNLRALVYECERNPREAVLAHFERLAKALDVTPASARAIAPPRRPNAAEPIDAAAVRRIQRTLVRLQHDAAFRDRFAAGEAEALASSGVSGAGLATLRALDPIAIAADRDGRRQAQLLRNLGSELAASAAVGPAGDGDAAWIEAFPASAHFHDAIVGDAPLPLAFACFAEACAAASSSALFRALVALDVAMLRARRATDLDVAPAPGAIQLSARATIVALPEGTHAASVAIAASAANLAALRIDPARVERVLLVRDGTMRFGRLPALRVEMLAPPVDAFLDAARAPLDRAAVARFAAAHDLDLADLDAGVADFVADGVLVRGGV